MIVVKYNAVLSELTGWVGGLSEVCVAALPFTLLRSSGFLFTLCFLKLSSVPKKAVKNGLITYQCLLCLSDFPFGCAELHKGKKGALSGRAALGSSC